MRERGRPAGNSVGTQVGTVVAAEFVVDDLQALLGPFQVELGSRQAAVVAASAHGWPLLRRPSGCC
jgi:hypothetical protein